MNRKLSALPLYGVDGALNVIVECPRDARLKIAYDEKLRVFAVERPLPLGLSFPFDFGFVPGTRAPDGDPVDALVLNDIPTHPGVLIKCRTIGMVELTQNAEHGGGRETNNRLIMLPAWRDDALVEAEDLPDKVRAQIEQFFLSVDFFTDKHAEITGWVSARKATRYVAKHAT